MGTCLTRRHFVSVALAGSAAALLSCTAAPSAPATTAPAPAASTPPTTVAPGAAAPRVSIKINTSQILPESGTFVAMDRGYFDQEGIDVELVPVNGSAETIPMLSSDQIQLGYANPDPSAFNAIARGIGIKVIFPQLVLLPGAAPSSIVVRQDLVDSGQYRTPADLKGMKIGVNIVGSGQQFYVERALNKGGLTVDDATLTPLQNPPNVLAAFTNKNIDAAFISEPFPSQAEASGIGKVAIPLGDVFPGPFSLMMISPNFARQQTDAANRATTAILRAQRDVWHAFDVGDGDKDTLVKILIAHTSVKDPQVYGAMEQRHGLGGIEPNGIVDVAPISEQQDYFLKIGTQNDKIDMTQLVDNSFIAYALQRLGKV
jgi:NitT/TauT family transport system substrate-binding protein